MSTDFDTSPAAEDGLPSALIERHWLGETSLSEAARVDTWFRAHPEQRAVYTRLGDKLHAGFFPILTPDEWEQRRTAILASAVQPEFAKTSDAEKNSSVELATKAGSFAEGRGLGRILAFPQQPAKESAGMAGQATVTKLFRGWSRRDSGQHSLFRTVGFGVAAGAVFLALAVGMGRVVMYRNDAHSPVSVHAAPMREVATAAGQRAQVKLGDGSVVTLGVKSRLRFASDFGAHARDLYLEGEAYFVVAHDTARPFVVHAAGTRTVDVGTEFVLRAYQADEAVQVVVADGIVALGADHASAPAPVILERGQMGRIIKGTLIPSVRTVDPDKYLGWMTGRLVFDNVPVSDVIAELERWYDVDIRFDDPTLARATFTANFTAESLTETLKTLTTVLNLRAERGERTVVLYRRSEDTHASSH